MSINIATSKYVYLFCFSFDDGIHYLTKNTSAEISFFCSEYIFQVYIIVYDLQHAIFSMLLIKFVKNPLYSKRRCTSDIFIDDSSFNGRCFYRVSLIQRNGRHLLSNRLACYLLPHVAASTDDRSSCTWLRSTNSSSERKKSKLVANNVGQNHTQFPFMANKDFDEKRLHCVDIFLIYLS